MVGKGRLVMRKVLWLVDGNKNKLLKKADYIRAQSVCIRTTNSWLEGSVKEIKQLGFDVYGWRWPAVIEPNPDPHHHYALNEAAFVERVMMMWIGIRFDNGWPAPTVYIESKLFYFLHRPLEPAIGGPDTYRLCPDVIRLFQQLVFVAVNEPQHLSHN